MNPNQPIFWLLRALFILSWQHKGGKRETLWKCLYVL